LASGDTPVVLVWLWKVVVVLVKVMWRPMMAVAKLSECQAQASLVNYCLCKM